MKSPVRAAIALKAVGVGVACVVVLNGCQSPRNILAETRHEGESIASASAPRWIMGPRNDEESDPDKYYFVGRSVGYNVFDERGAYDAAVDHVLQQLAKRVHTRVKAYTKDVDVSRRERFLARERVRQSLKDVAKMRTDALARAVREEEVYWERWEISEEPRWPCFIGRVLCRDCRMARWKCWVLMSLDRDLFDDTIEDTWSLLEAERVAPAVILRVLGH